MVDQVKSIEASYSENKSKLNEFDAITARSGITTQTVSNSFNILKGLLAEGKSQSASFDK